MGLATNEKQNKKGIRKRVVKEAIFLSHFFIFHHKPKRLLKFLQNGF